MNFIKTTVISLVFLSVSVIAPAAALSTESTTPSSKVNIGNLKLTLVTESDVSLVSGSHTNQDVIKLNWNNVTDAAAYTLYSWSDTKAPGVRLLTSEQISSEAKLTKYTGNSTVLTLPREGVYYYAVKATDQAGEVLAESEISKLTFDKTAPKISVINPKFNQEIIGNSLIANGTVSDTNLDYYYFVLRNATGQTLLTSSHITDTVIDGVIANLDISTFLSGHYDIGFVARDKAGNQASLMDAEETASFIVLRKGESNNFSSPPRPIEPSTAVVVPETAPAITKQTAAPKFKLVSSQNVLGATSQPAGVSPNMAQTVPSAEIIAVAKAPAKQTSNTLYLALIPMLMALILLSFKQRQTVPNK